MSVFKIVPEIHMLKTADELKTELRIGGDDLVIAGSVWRKYFGGETAGQVLIVSDFAAGEPTDELIERLHAAVCRPYKRVIGMGGGTVLDCAKLFVLERLLPVPDLFDRKFDAVKDKKLVLIPTTCGTGSEVTNISILEFTSRDTKFGLADDAIFADEAYIVPGLLEGIPYRVFAASSLDALVHAAESFLSPKASALSKMFSVGAIERIIRGYMRAAEEGHECLNELLPGFCEASVMAGIAFGNAGCAAVHAMSYPLGAVFHVPHGESNYSVFTGVLRKYIEKRPDGDIKQLIGRLAGLLGCGDGEVLCVLDSLLSKAAMPRRSLGEYGMTRDTAHEFAVSVTENQQRLLANNYVPLSKEEIEEIYNSLL